MTPEDAKVLDLVAGAIVVVSGSVIGAICDLVFDIKNRTFYFWMGMLTGCLGWYWVGGVGR